MTSLAVSRCVALTVHRHLKWSLMQAFDVMQYTDVIILDDNLAISSVCLACGAIWSIHGTYRRRISLNISSESGKP